MSGSNLDNLPNEVIHRILVFVSRGECQQDRKIDMKNIRLASRKLSIVACAFLVSSTTVCLNSNSLSRFQQLCDHPLFSQCIRSVEINAAYYDVRLSQDRDLYRDHCGSALARILTLAELNAGPKQRQSGALCRESDVCNRFPRHLGEFGIEDLSADSADAFESLLSVLHNEYKMRTSDQECIRKNNRHLDRLCNAFARLSSLKSIHLTNGIDGGVQPETIPTQTTDLWDSGAFACALAPSGWNGSLAIAYITQPPIEMLGELLSSLGDSGARPSSFTLSFSVPANLTCLKVSERQAEGICKLVSKTDSMDVTFHSWPRGSSTACNHSRSYSELQALGSVTTALTSAPSLRCLRVSLAGYVWWQQLPHVVLKEFIPVGSWPNLKQLELGYLPCELSELEKLVITLHNHLESFYGRGLYLRSGDWDDAANVLRDSNKLNIFKLDRLRGGSHGSRKAGCDNQETVLPSYMARRDPET
ncbi:hypothetical protein HRR90_008376 [Exophiala dermatitidis]|uniref:Uncharacterized protein n=2 Tax=Exophiala dermatitidis TaxID=5970 RepID=H6BRW9_EXODN|nr:uncharacterized protein HMPREF1120_02961 [Exophiala dermatitidis NIH/UT8656]KAJ4517978.1 hypothetical protein HRR75_003199 [Exophiala dermatitidis]EHY54797.1 hypothetical protein HMPREF1120_02961 [Exophiala dermatitidis NIH/UT8656]KAJ4521670.1 hypothetical protein HRR74_003495 [Exophiala dermatitidis]KAJ4545092.1 hypothetical protein HRR76_003121 [Exophiala dermatitidis]KAJ4552250.1 hypothetical protein HRR78_003819 [Exophiala dermatitidis]